MLKAEFTFNRHALSCKIVRRIMSLCMHDINMPVLLIFIKQKCVDLKFKGSAWIVLTHVLLCVILLEFVCRPFTTAIIEIYTVSLNYTHIVNCIFTILTNQKGVCIIYKYFRKCSLITMLCNVRLFSNPDTHISIVKLISDI